MSDLVRRARRAVADRWKVSGRHDLVDRAAGRERALLLIAGHKPYLWPYTLGRIARDVPADVDVCVVAPGVDAPALRAIAASHGWSYLTTRANQVGVAQNLAIAAVPAAGFIYKVDEDVFVSAGFFDDLLVGYHRVETESEFAVGFCAPVLNVNGFSYVDFLRAEGLEDAYRERFGPTRRAADRIPVQQDGDAATWLWQHSLPVDAVAERFRGRPFGWSICPHRFSIGAILFRRELWVDMGGYQRVLARSGVGWDEQRLCVACLSHSRIMAVVHNVFAGHFSFGGQEPAMRTAFEARLGDF
jgi:hypothetical protein